MSLASEFFPRTLPGWYIQFYGPNTFLTNLWHPNTGKKTIKTYGGMLYNFVDQHKIEVGHTKSAVTKKSDFFFFSKIVEKVKYVFLARALLCLFVFR